MASIVGNTPAEQETVRKYFDHSLKEIHFQYTAYIEKIKKIDPENKNNNCSLLLKNLRKNFELAIQLQNRTSKEGRQISVIDLKKLANFQEDTEDVHNCLYRTRSS